MGNNKLKMIAWVLSLVVAFVAGGWVFSRMLSNGAATREVESWYTKDGASVGIFDVPPADLAAAEAVSLQALQPDLANGFQEDSAQDKTDGQPVSSAVDLTDIAAIVPPVSAQELDETESQKNMQAAAPIQLHGDEVVVLQAKDVPMEVAAQEGTNRAMLSAPVRYFIIDNLAGYKAFKQNARGSYPTLDFNKEKLVVLESDSNLPDNIFEIVSTEEKDGKRIVSYRVNILQLDKRLNSHAVITVPKKSATVELNQVL